jgi:UDP-glucose 4-epimerase
MTVLVTGGAGYIGSHTVHELVDSGERVLVLDNLSMGFLCALPKAALAIIGDVGDQALVTSIIDNNHVDAIVHFAGSIVVPDSVRDPLGYYQNNTVNSRALIETAVKCGVRSFIFSSTAAVYGNPDRVPVHESAPTIPVSPYGWSKLMTEIMLCDAGRAHALSFAILRYFNVAGADPKGRTGQSTPNATHLIKVAVQVALGQREYLEVFGSDYPTPDGTCVRDFIHVTDLARAHGAALNYLRNGKPSITLNCGYGRGYSVLEVVQAIRRVADIDLAVRMAQRRAGDSMAIVAEASRIRERLDWVPAWDDLDAMVGHALAWERHLMRSSAATRT